MWYPTENAHSFCQRDRWTAVCAVSLGFLLAGLSSPAFAQSYKLDEPLTDSRTYSLTRTMKVTGNLSVPLPKGKSLPLALTVNAKLKCRERRLSGTGRDAKAFRTLRYYEETSVRAKVGNNVTSRSLRENRRLIVAQGTTQGLEYYSPAGAMTYNELGLLDMPGDSLSLLALLPSRRVSLGGQWSPRSWAVQMLTGTEVAEKAEMTCRLESVTKNQARVNFKGSVVGAKHGAGTRVLISGHFLYNLQRGYIQKLDLTQQEQSAAGPISPAMDVRAIVVMDRKLTSAAGPLKTSLVSRLPLKPSKRLMRIRFDTPWHLRFHHSRQWHLRHQSEERATLQLLDRGNLVAQVNVRSLPKAAKGEHLSDLDFQKNIRTMLGKKLQSIVKAELLKTSDERYLYRVVALGKIEKSPMQWIFYLCASPSGRQVMLEFTVEKNLVKPLQNRDVRFVTSLDFLEP